MNDKVVMIGSSSTLSNSLEGLGLDLIRVGRRAELTIDFERCSGENGFINIPLDNKFYCINSGKLIGKKIEDASDSEIISSLRVNLIGCILACEYILKNNDMARIVLIGSESGTKGSYDTTYFLSKAALSAYVRERRVGKSQQLVIVSPSTIEDGGMTKNRSDKERLDEYRSNHPKSRFLYMEELAVLVKTLLIDCSEYLTNTEIEFNGGKFARMI